MTRSYMYTSSAVWQWAAIVGSHVVEDHLLAVGFVDRHIGSFFELADGACGLGPLVQSSTIWRSSVSIFLRQSLISIVVLKLGVIFAGDCRSLLPQDEIPLSERWRPAAAPQ